MNLFGLYFSKGSAHFVGLSHHVFTSSALLVDNTAVVVSAELYDFLCREAYALSCAATDRKGVKMTRITIVQVVTTENVHGLCLSKHGFLVRYYFFC